MKKNRVLLSSIFVILLSLIQPFLVNASNSEIEREPDFVLAVFATTRSRASLLEKSQDLNILAYNVNWESQIDLENNCIRNVWMRADGRWIRVDKVPLPNVVYDFGVYKNAKSRKKVANQLKDKLRSLNIPFINPEEAMDVVNDKVFFSKMMHKYGIPHPKTRKYKKSHLEKMLKHHDLLFLKPTFGSKGQGIIIVKKIDGSSPKLYSLTYKINHRGEWQTVRTAAVSKKEVFASVEDVRKKMNKRRVPYLIQQGINAFRYDGQQTDFRINVGRGQNAELISTGMAMRVGGNLSQGGRPADHHAVLSKSNLSSETVGDQVIATAMKTHIAIEKATGKKIGDLGMDAVIDDKGKVFIIEANNKNGYLHTYIRKNPKVDQLYNLPPSIDLCEQMDAAHEAQIIEYARYLVHKK